LLIKALTENSQSQVYFKKAVSPVWMSLCYGSLYQMAGFRRFPAKAGQDAPQLLSFNI
jgi:hypothetical protein